MTVRRCQVDQTFTLTGVRQKIARCSRKRECKIERPCERNTDACISRTFGGNAKLADAYVQSVDRNVEQLRSLGLVDQAIIMGPIVDRRGYAADRLDDSRVLIQAAISTDHGTSAIFWAPADFALYRHDERFEAEAIKRLRPLRECSLTIQAKVWPHIAPMLSDLLGRCRMICE